MKRNAFTFDQHGHCHHFEPDMEHENDSSSEFLVRQRRETRHKGAALCLSQCVSLDALLSLQQLVQSELTVRAEMEMNPEAFAI
jgi:hypothetical protein